MISLKLSAVAFAIAALGTSALAQSAVGTWNGHIELGKIPLPPNAPPQARQRAEQGMAMLKKISILLTLKKDKTYSVVTSGFGKGDNETGTWAQTGKTITLKSAKKNHGPDSQSMTISPNGKTLTMVPPTGNGGPSVKVIFNKK